MKIYAMSDIHGCINEFNNALKLIDLEDTNTMLILLGDYIHGGDSIAVLDKVIELQKQYGDQKVVALMGNHEEAVAEFGMSLTETDTVEHHVSPLALSKYKKWMKKLPRYYKTDTQIFCHAGVDEEAEDLWEVGTDPYMFTGKFPPETGEFYMDIIAGHTGTFSPYLSNDANYHDIYFDGHSHYFIDGATVHSGVIPILLYDTETKKYYSVKNDGTRLLLNTPSQT